uniref:Putative secreted protein n=1 Tax=Ixodes ricinus TaxID=34613 RepID=V5GXE4_IXORI
MHSSFIFCLLAMYYIASANANPCWDIPGVPCLRLCEDLHEGQKLTTKAPDTRCTKPGGRPGKCNGGQCE